ncbi:hypothetical protein BJY04DRAFT_220259 [Aspergillus karnatakaensis]|uniref:putative copper-activated transcription factor GRISEA n=1 Tax=Aspergillus karnatakaensis TaxID=1810916 RepID=UPI003CCCB7CC
MPFDENGIKWSCEPCIRGHRSSKCAHFDRLMVSVGKAGRPLSKCPHVQGSCNCKKLCAFMVAIPKAGTGCLCRPVYKMLLDENGPTPPVSQLPINITTGSVGSASASPSPSKIQKSSKKSVKVAPEQATRPLHSIPELHQFALQHGNPDLNVPAPQPQPIENPYITNNGLASQPNVFTAVDNLSNSIGSTTGASPNGVCLTNTFQPPSHPAISMPARKPGSCCSSSRPEGSTVPHELPSHQIISTLVQTPGSCCSNSRREISEAPLQLRPQSATSLPAQTPGPCCSSSRRESSHAQPPPHLTTSTPSQTTSSCCSDSFHGGPIKVESPVIQDVFAASPMTVSSIAQAPSSNWQGFSGLNGHLHSVDGSTNGFHHTLSGVSFQHPFTEYSNPASLGFNQISIPQSYPIAPVGHPVFAHPGYTEHTSGTAHSCSCGPKCNCYACPDHPYNDVTVQHVQEIGRIIAEDSQSDEDGDKLQAPEANGTTHANGPPVDQPLIDPINHLTTDYDPMPSGQCCGSGGDELDGGAAAENLEAFPENPLMSHDAYYTYEYQVGLPGACAGEAGDCQCGPSCTCLGCLTHGNN